MTQLYLDLQLAIEPVDTVPNRPLLEQWIVVTLDFIAVDQGIQLDDEYEITIRVVDEHEIQALNKQYRFKDKPTNVLSFPFESPAEVSLPLLGDLVVCHKIVKKEAIEQQKKLQQHWAHMVVHGVLHLLGYDHIEEGQAQQMENLEIKILANLGFDNPYEN